MISVHFNTAAYNNVDCFIVSTCNITFKMIAKVFLSLIILNVSGKNIKSVMGNILIIPMPAFSALYRSACLAQHLKDNGQNVTVVLPDGQPKTTLLEEFDFDHIVSEGMTKAMETLDEVVSSMVPAAFSGSKLGIFSILKLRRLCYYLGNDEKLFDVLMQRQFKIAVLNMAVINLCVSIIPYKLGIPFIWETIIPQEARSLIHPAVFPVNVLIPSTDNMTFLERLGNTVYYGMYLLKPDLFNPSDIVGTFAPMKEHISNAELKAKTELYLVDYDELVEHHLPLYPNMIPVGGLSTRPPRQLSGKLKEFMDSAQEGAVIVSLGSMIKFISREVEETMMASFKRFENIKFVFKFANESRIDANIMLMSWIPQNDLLGHQNTKVFITHCGYNAQYDALYNAVPIIALPISGDQPYNSVTMQAKGFGIKLDLAYLTENDLVSALDRILKNPVYKNNIAKASEIFRSRPLTPAQRAAWWIDHVIKYGGKYLQPSVARLPFYQFLLLDVIVGIMLMSVVVAFSCYFVCRCVFQSFRIRKHKND